MAPTIDLERLGLLGRIADHYDAIQAERKAEEEKVKIEDTCQVEVIASCGRLLLAFRGEHGELDVNSLGERYRLLGSTLFPQPEDDEEPNWDVKLSTWRPSDVNVMADMYGSFILNVSVDSHQGFLGKKQRGIKLKCIETNIMHERYDEVLSRLGDAKETCKSAFFTMTR